MKDDVENGKENVYDGGCEPLETSALTHGAVLYE